MYTLTIGDKAYSSWSLRGYLLLAAFDLPFEERLVEMYDPGFDAMQQAHAPARTVPQLAWHEGGRTRRVWDTAAIAETLAERHPDAGIWPEDPWHRAVARCLAAEMHSGFAALRQTCPMNFHRPPGPLANPPAALAGDLARLAQIWAWAVAETGGPWLGGPRYSAADAFFTPVASRLESYGLIAPETEATAARLLTHPAYLRWHGAAMALPHRLTHYDRD